MVYHYTTIESFYNMLAAYKESDDKDHLVFWASYILDQNDLTEFSLKSEHIISCLQKIEEEKPYKDLTDFRKFSSINSYNWLPTLLNQNSRRGTKEMWNDELNVPYTISFSNNEDNLLMWTMYSNNGNGLCLAFNENELLDDKTYIFTLADNVKYVGDPETLDGILKNYYDKYLNAISKMNILQEIDYTKVNYWTRFLTCLVPFVKNRAFESEAEYRIAIFKKNKDTPKVFSRISGRLNIIHYIKFKIPIVALNHIVIGPCADYKRLKNLLESNMKECGIGKIKNHRFFRKSHVPYRLF